MVERNRDITVGAKFVAKDEVTQPIERIARNTTRATASMASDFKKLEMAAGKLSSTFGRIGSLIGGPILIASKEAARRNSELANSFTINEIAIKRFNDTVGNAAAPALVQIGVTMNHIVDTFQKMDPAVLKSSVAFGLWASKSLLMLAATAKIVQTMAILKPLFVSIGHALTSAAGPWLILAAAISAAAFALDAYNKYTKEKLRMSVVSGFDETIKALEEEKKRTEKRIAEMKADPDDPYAGTEKTWRGISITEPTSLEDEERRLENINEGLIKLRANRKAANEVAESTSPAAAAKEYLRLITEIGQAQEAEAEKLRKEDSLLARNAYREKRGDYRSGVKEGLEASLREFYDFNNKARKMMEGLFQDIEGFFGDYFYNILKGNFDNLRDLISDFGDMLLRMLAELAANKLIDMLLGGNGKNLSVDSKRAAGVDEPESFAVGGYVRRSGAAIVHKGENIIPSINGSMRIPAPATRAVTGGGGGNVTVVVQSWDAQDVLRNSGAITKAVVDGMSRNGAIRQGMKRYL